ncbi:hypothetical protein [Streptomyces sp. NPDC002276]
MSDTTAMEQAAGQAGQTAAMALQVLVMAAQALLEHQKREAARAAAAPPPAPEAKDAPRPEPERDPDRDRYAQMVRDSVEPSAVAVAMVTSPQWPQVADELRRLERAGVNVATFIGDAAPLIARVDADMRTGSPTPGVIASATASTPPNPFAAPVSDTRPEREGPGVVERFIEWMKRAIEAVKEWFQKLTGRGEKSVLDGWEKDLAKNGVSPQENARAVITAREAMADENVLGSLVASREWPGIAAQMKAAQAAGHDPREALAGVPLRMKQATDAGISLSPAEAARGLLNEQAKAPALARTPAAPAPASTAPAAAQSAPSAPARAVPAAAPKAPRPVPKSAAEKAAGAAAQPPPRRIGEAPRVAPAVAPSRAAAATAQSTTAAPGSSPAPGPQAAPTRPAQGPTQGRGHTR